MRISLTALTGGGPRDIVIDGDSELTVESVSRSLTVMLDGSTRPELAPVVRHPAVRVPQQGLWLNGRLLDPAAPAVRALRDGAVVTTDAGVAPATVLEEPAGAVEFRVVGGPAAGTVHRLGLGTATLGSSGDTDVRLLDRTVPGRSLRLTIERDRVTVEPSHLTEALLDGVRLDGAAVWPTGALLRVGTTVLAHTPSAVPDAHLEPLPEGGLAYNRPPRITPRPRPRTLRAPRRPERNDKQRLRLFGALLFSAFGLVMAFGLGQWWWALFALAWPVMQVGEWLGDRMHGRTSYKKALRAFEAESAGFGSSLEMMRREDEAARRILHPDAAEVLLTATGPRRRLWERRPSDPDRLHLRVGLADLPADITVEGAEPPPARDVPVALPLAELGTVGVTGERSAARGLARWLVAQAAALHSPRDLAIVVLAADPAGAECWNWVRWLPHCTPREGEECVALVGSDPESVARRVTELAIRITERRRAAQDSPFGRPEQPYDILVVLDGARSLRRVPGMPQVLTRGPEYGVYAVCVDDDERTLPEECTAVAAVGDDAGLRLRGQGLEALGPVLADQVSAAWCERLGRALAPVRDVSREDAAEGLPVSVRLLDLLGMPDPAAGKVLEAWSRGGTTRVPLGPGPDGVHSVDLVRDGPHGLIAGTTGAGKSELLQTVIAGLAVANRPDEMAFVLIDYKGGAAFSDCARLPHTVGMVTDLDGHLTSRALSSLAAELRRRESLLLAAGAKDLDDYLRLPSRPEPLPRLVLVIDEFAALVTELPDFVAGLVDIGRRGRSLGVHLLLATQRPAGVVTADIRANTNLRIALRVTDPEESADVIDGPEAAAIPKSAPGRCYVKSGAGVAQAVQSARIGGRRRSRGRAVAREAAVVELGWPGLGRPLPVASPASSAPDDEGQATDLKALVAAVREAAERARIPAPRSPWLAPLPDELVLSPKQPTGGSRTEPAEIVFGVTDLPDRQSLGSLSVDLAGSGHIYIAGAARSGRSTALRSFAGALAASCSPYDVQIYAVDCGAGALQPLTALPHCGAVVPREQPDRVERLLGALADEVARRQQVLAEAGFASLAEQRRAAPAGERMPWMVLLLDRWEGFAAAFEHYDYGRLVTGALQLLREGAAVGLRGVFAGDRTGLAGQVSTVFDRRLVLRMADPADYGYAGFNERQIPAHLPPGRVLELVTPGAPPREGQIGLLSDDTSGTGQVATLQELGKLCQDRYGRLPRAQRPLRVDELPARVTTEEALALDPDTPAPSPLWALAGVGGDALAPLGVDLLAEGPGFVVAGPARAGRSTALRTLAQSLLDPGVAGGLIPVLLITPRRSPLRLLAGRPGVLGVLDAEATADDLESLLEAEHRYVIVVDDAELLADTELDDALARQLRTARDGEHAVIVGGTTQDLSRGYRGFVADARRSRSGLLLGIESADDGELLGLRLPRNATFGGPLGRGLFVLSARPTQLQVALPPPLPTE